MPWKRAPNCATRHALAVEACVVAYARKFGEDQCKWSVTALLHDFDYEIHPKAPEHPMQGEPILAARGWIRKSAARFRRSRKRCSPAMKQPDS